MACLSHCVKETSFPHHFITRHSVRLAFWSIIHLKIAYSLISYSRAHAPQDMLCTGWASTLSVLLDIINLCILFSLEWKGEHGCGCGINLIRRALVRVRLVLVVPLLPGTDRAPPTRAHPFFPLNTCNTLGPIYNYNSAITCVYISYYNQIYRHTDTAIIMQVIKYRWYTTVW